MPIKCRYSLSSSAINKYVTKSNKKTDYNKINYTKNDNFLK